MKLASRLLLGVAVLAAFPISSPATAAEPKKESGFASMFDGKSLDGWSVTPSGAAKAWSVQDGVIIGEGDKGRSYLVYDNKDLADFELKFSYKFPGKGNSGVSIRA
ncbi:MAG: DUF1080 domain-containing protein, partial [Planctomycetales bacterium]